MKRLIFVMGALVLVALAAFVAITKAEPPSGVTATVLARGTDYAAHSTTGWHSHPGPIFITVTQEQLTYYELDDPACTPHVVTAGQGFVDDGRGHVVRNETDQPAQESA
jgi:hypothetical protein